MSDMTGDTIASLIYLVILGTVIGGAFVVGNRVSLGQSARIMATWALIFIGFIAAYGLWEDIQRQLTPTRAAVVTEDAITVQRRFDGHFHLTLDINGTAVPFIVDTGATDLVLTQGDAQRVGLVLDELIYSRQAQTANGMVRIAPVRLDRVSLGNFTDQNVRASVNGGELSSSLLGMSYLSRFETLQIQGDRLTLVR